MTKTALRLAELQAKPDRTPWEERHIKHLANDVRKQQRYHDPVHRGERKLRAIRRLEAQGL